MTGRGGRRKPLGRLLLHYEAMYVVLILQKNHPNEEASNAQVVAGGAGISSVATINSTKLTKIRKFLEEQGLIETREEGRTVYYKLTENGARLGGILSNLSDFLVERLGW
jgi:predicted transcriptional regulator